MTEGKPTRKRRMSAFRGWLDRAYKPISIALAAATPVVAFLVSLAAAAPLIALLLVVQAVVAASSWFLSDGRAKSLERERVEARGDTLLGLTDGLEPVLVELARVSTLATGERRHERSGLLLSVLSAATFLGAVDSRARACYFKLADEGERRMEHERSHGRSVEAKAEFRRGTEAGDAALAMIDAGETLFCYDVDDDPPAGWEPKQRGEYKTFISVAVRAGDHAFGMLTVDAVSAGALTVEDEKIMRALGHLLGLVEQMTA